MTAPDCWGQQQQQLVTVELFLLVLLGTWFLTFVVCEGDHVTSIGVKACLWVGARRGRALAAETSQAVESSFGEVDHATHTQFRRHTTTSAVVKALSHLDDLANVFNE